MVTRLLAWLAGLRTKAPPDVQQRHSIEGEPLAAWIARANRVPEHKDAGTITLPAPYVARATARAAQERALLAQGYHRWRQFKPPVGIWVETVRLGQFDNSEVWHTSAWWPDRNLDDLRWRVCAEPMPGMLILERPPNAS